jgi:hypothetical protein
VLQNDPQVRNDTQGKKRRVPVITDQDALHCACEDDSDEECVKPGAIRAVHDKADNLTRRLRNPRWQCPR